MGGIFRIYQQNDILALIHVAAIEAQRNIVKVPSIVAVADLYRVVCIPVRIVMRGDPGDCSGNLHCRFPKLKAFGHEYKAADKYSAADQGKNKKEYDSKGIALLFLCAIILIPRFCFIQAENFVLVPLTEIKYDRCELLLINYNIKQRRMKA